MTDENRKRRRAANRWGKAAEWIAAIYLLTKGYRILALRYKTKLGEIDLVARKGDLAVMAEVKARGSVQQAVDAVSAQSMRRIRNASDLWLAKQPMQRGFRSATTLWLFAPGNCRFISKMRFDIATVRLAP